MFGLTAGERSIAPVNQETRPAVEGFRPPLPPPGRSRHESMIGKP